MTPRYALQNERGFTLTEALVVTVLVIIMMGLGHSGFSALQRREGAKAAAYQLAGNLKEARMLAIEKHASHAIIFNGNQYAICRQAAPPDCDCDCLDAEDLNTLQVDVTAQYSDVSIVANGFPIRFDAKGMPRNSAGGLVMCSVDIKYKNVTSYQVVISSLGRIKVDEI